MELLQLKYFYESGRNGSFAKTAEKFMVPPSSVSAAIKRLETELGCKLFDRYKNSVSLNEKGREFLCSVGYIFDELNSAVERVSIDCKQIKILVKSLRKIILNLIIKYRKNHPDTEFIIHLDNNEMDESEFDLIVSRENHQCTELQKFELCSTEMHLRTNPESPLVGKKLTLKDLRHESFITMGSGTYMHGLLIEACARAGFSPKIVVQVNDSACYSKCMEAGMGIGPTRFFKLDKAKRAELGVLDISDFNEKQHFCVYHKKTASESLRNFIEFLKAETTDLASGKQ